MIRTRTIVMSNPSPSLIRVVLAAIYLRRLIRVLFIIVARRWFSNKGELSQERECHPDPRSNPPLRRELQHWSIYINSALIINREFDNFVLLELLQNFLGFLNFFL